MSKTIERRVVVATLVVVAVVVAVVVVLPRVANAFGGASAIHDAAALSDNISVCGRNWSKDVRQRQSSLAEIRARDGVEPVIVDPGPFAPCPVGPCTRVAQDIPCDTVIYVRVGQDAYIDYSLGAVRSPDRRLITPPARC